jgi:hypothetical protein
MGKFVLAKKPMGLTGRERIALAKAKGVYKGRKPALYAQRGLGSCESRLLQQQTGQSWRKSLG